MRIPKSISREEYLRLIRNKGGSDVGQHDTGDSRDSNETIRRMATGRSNDTENTRRIDNKNNQNLEVAGEERGKPEEIEETTEQPAEKPKDNEFECDTCGNPVLKGQEICGFCKSPLNWDGIG